MNRRHFLKNTALSGFVMVTPGMSYHWVKNAWAANPEITRITILHTNDVHSRIDPFPNDGSRNAGVGGASKRAALIKKIRAENEHILLLDAGDIFQGTPYFNFFGGEIEMKLMTEMGYDAATIGNHDFDNGIEGLEKQLVHADFPLLNSNYDFSNTVMNGKSQEYLIKDFNGIKVGIFGVGIELEGLVPKELYKETIYSDPMQAAQKSIDHLKSNENCDYVICLSHLGYRYREDKISDYVLAQNTKGLDLIIGGHTHTFLNEPELIYNLSGEKVVINQVGWAGIMLGRLDITFERNSVGKCLYCSNTFIK
jgi:5'-nucleotidase